MTIGSILQPNTSQAQSDLYIYSCIEKNGIPLTVVDTDRGRIELITWKQPYFRDLELTPQQRCVEVSSRFQQFSDSKRLRYITTGKMNGYPVICIGQYKPPQGYSCMGDSLLITLQQGENPDEILENLFQEAMEVSGWNPPIVRCRENKYVFPLYKYIETYPYPESEGINSTKPEESPANCPPILCD